MATVKSRDFVILGPSLTKNNKVLEAIHALYFLPENFKLVFTRQSAIDQKLYKKVAELVERDGLRHRVLFFSDSRNADAAIAGAGQQAHDETSVHGDSAEAIASALLNIARAQA